MNNALDAVENPTLKEQTLYLWGKNSYKMFWNICSETYIDLHKAFDVYLWAQGTFFVKNSMYFLKIRFKRNIVAKYLEIFRRKDQFA